jgi:hypothetical protein
MKLLIIDEFTYLPISRQRRYQLRKKRAKKCVLCGAPAVGLRCLRHMIEARELKRRRLALKRRYKSLTYRLAKRQEKRRPQ